MLFSSFFFSAPRKHTPGRYEAIHSPIDYGSHGLLAWRTVVVVRRRRELEAWVVGVSSSFSVFSFVSLFCCSAPAFPFYGIIFFIATPPFSRSIYGSSFGLRVVAQLVTRACLPEEMPLAAPSLAEKGEGYLMKCGTAGCCVEPIYELCGAGLHACFFYIWRDFFERNILIPWIFFFNSWWCDLPCYNAWTKIVAFLFFSLFNCDAVTTLCRMNPTWKELFRRQSGKAFF